MCFRLFSLRLHENRFFYLEQEERKLCRLSLLVKMLHWRWNGKKFLRCEREPRAEGARGKGGSKKTSFCRTKERKMSRIQHELEIAFFPYDSRSHTHDTNKRISFHTFTILEWICLPPWTHQINIKFTTRNISSWDGFPCSHRAVLVCSLQNCLKQTLQSAIKDSWTQQYEEIRRGIVIGILRRWNQKRTLSVAFTEGASQETFSSLRILLLI